MHEVDDLLYRPCGVGRVRISLDEAFGFAFEEFQLQVAAGLKEEKTDLRVGLHASTQPTISGGVFFELTGMN